MLVLVAPQQLGGSWCLHQVCCFCAKQKTVSGLFSNFVHWWTVPATEQNLFYKMDSTLCDSLLSSGFE